MGLIKLFGYVYDPRTARMIFHELLAIGFDIYDIDNNIYCSAILCSIAVSGNIEVMQYMLGELSKILTERQINDIINKSYAKETVLTKAVKYNNIDMVRFLLLRFRININVRDKNGKTPLSWAVCTKNVEIVKLLLASDKIDVSTVNIFRETPLSCAVCINNVEIVKLLLTNNKIDVNIANVYGETPLHEAVRDEDVGIVKCLLKAKAYYVNEKIKDVKDKQMEISKQIEILEDVKNKYANHKIFIEEAIEEFKACFNYSEIKKSKCNIL